MGVEQAVFADFEKDQLSQTISRYESTIEEIEGNLQAPDFYEGDREEVERSKASFEEEVRRLKIERELAICAGLPSMAK